MTGAVAALAHTVRMASSRERPANALRDRHRSLTPLRVVRADVSTTAEFTVDAESFPLGSGFRGLSGASGSLSVTPCGKNPAETGVLDYAFLVTVISTGASARSTSTVPE